MASININAEISGSIWKILVKTGDRVQAGDTLIIIESMKMEIPVEAPEDGIVELLHVKETDTIEEDQLLVTIQS
jgi:acetyl-CoA carboxylase biotin carboxyl carrier protein